MDYVIVNPQKNIYIRTENGVPITCSKQRMQRFEYSKACNILAHLPRSLHKFHFKVEPIPEVPILKMETENNNEKYIRGAPVLFQGVRRWVERAKECNDFAKEVLKRKSELIHELSNADKQLSNYLHEIELSSNMNACAGYKAYKRTKELLKRRREVKDELCIVDAILSSNLQSIATDHLQKTVDRLNQRKFTIREIDCNDCDVEVMSNEKN